MTTPEDSVLLTNLTGHVVRIDSAEPGGPPVVLPPTSDPRPLVAEPPAGERILRGPHGSVQEISMWRSRTVHDLPPPRPGTTFVVPRLTALAADDRDDLVFPHQEHRTAGVVDGATAFGRFMPPLVPLPSVYRPPKTLRLLVRLFGRGLRAVGWSDVPQITRWTGVTFAVATAFLGGAIGTAPALVGADPSDAAFWPTLLSAVGLLAIGLWALYGGTKLWRLREEILTQRGTAYIIEETAEAWTYEEKRRFLEQLVGHFASVQRVPGTDELGGDWHWPLGPGAEHWDQHVDTLVRSFWSVHYNDDPRTDNCILIWCWWPVAIAFGARVTARRRGLTLLVRQRPSTGRNGRVDADGWRREPHDFAVAQSASVGHELPERTVHLTVSARPGVRTTAEPPESVTILLIRMTRTKWGPLAPDSPEGTGMDLDVEDAAGIDIAGTVTATLLEWRHLPPEGDVNHAWASYPALVRSASEWVGRRGVPLKGVVLLAALIPQEVGIGIGILAGQDGAAWPAQLWPIQAESDGPGKPPKRLVIPGLNLGATSLRQKGGRGDAV